MSTAKIPPDFISLQAALYSPVGTEHNVIGVCTDFLPAAKSRGTDYTLRFTLRDPTCSYGGGMRFQFFNREIADLPSIQNTGDVVILRCVKIAQWGSTVGLSNHSTRACVLAGASVADSQCDDGTDMTIQGVEMTSWKSYRPSIAELQYARAIVAVEDPTSYPAPAPSTSLHIASTIRANGGTVSASKDRFATVSELRHAENGQLLFVDLIGEIRRVYPGAGRVEISFTDYTSHPLLYDYTSEDYINAHDGDPFGYAGKTSGKWNGPWGQRTILISLWDAHATFFLQHAQDEQYVNLKNVQIKLDRNGARLEGHCRGDRYDPAKVNVLVMKPAQAESNSRLRDFLQRKKDYEAIAHKNDLPFQRNPRSKRKSDAIQDQPEQETKTKRAAKNRNNKHKKNKHAKAQEHTDTKQTSVKVRQQNGASVRCKNVQVRLSSISDILQSSILQRESLTGGQYALPFQNCCYKSKVRVVDYFPNDIRDFAAPHRKTEYDYLPDHASDVDSDVERAQQGDDDVSWEWRFFLLVEDADPDSRLDTTPNPHRMVLLVGQREGEHLLRETACDLHQEENRHILRKVSEKLYFLWGNLQVHKEDALKVLGNSEVTSNKSMGIPTTTDSQARPFECLIMEYGIPSRDRHGQIENDLEYQRMFQLFGVTV